MSMTEQEFEKYQSLIRALEKASAGDMLVFFAAIVALEKDIDPTNGAYANVLLNVVNNFMRTDEKSILNSFFSGEGAAFTYLSDEARDLLLTGGEHDV